MLNTTGPSLTTDPDLRTTREYNFDPNEVYFNDRPNEVLFFTNRLEIGEESVYEKLEISSHPLNGTQGRSPTNAAAEESKSGRLSS